MILDQRLLFVFQGTIGGCYVFNCIVGSKTDGIGFGNNFVFIQYGKLSFKVVDGLVGYGGVQSPNF